MFLPWFHQTKGKKGRKGNVFVSLLGSVALVPKATTVGYGDYVPTTTVGKLVAIMVFYVGIVTWMTWSVGKFGYGAPHLEEKGVIMTDDGIEMPQSIGISRFIMLHPVRNP